MPSKTKEIGKRRRSGRLATIRRTKENIVIFKVFIKYRNKNISKESLIQQFSSFGKIRDFTIINQNEEKTCKITYCDPMSAAHVLSCNFIRLNHSHIMVHPCSTWEQPLQITAYNENEPSTSSQFHNNPAQYTEDNILTLNDYCLEMIFKFLDLHDQLRFSFCHERLESIFVNMICPRFPQHLQLEDLCSGKLSDWEIWQFLKTAGQYIKYIKYSQKVTWKNITARESEILTMVKEFCINIQRVQIMKSFYHKLDFFVNINNLTEIELYSANMIDSDLEYLVKCENLISLGLARNSRLIGDFLPSLKQVQRLSLYTCERIKMDNLKAACINMNLKYLDIRTKSEENTCRSEVLKNCTELETLKMSLFCSKDLEHLSNLEKLKSLELASCYRINSSNLSTIFEKCNNNLETLKLIHLNDDALPHNMAKFSSLRTLWISMYGTSVDPKIIPFISSLKDLEELYINNIFVINDKDLKSVIQNCFKLKRLCLSDCNIKPDFIYTCSDILRKRHFNTPTTSAASEAALASSIKPLKIYLTETRIKSSFVKSFNTSDRNKEIILKKITDVPKDGFLSDDLPLDLKDLEYDERDNDDDDDSSDTSGDDSDSSMYNYENYDDDDDDDIDILFHRPLCDLM